MSTNGKTTTTLDIGSEHATLKEAADLVADTAIYLERRGNQIPVEIRYLAATILVGFHIAAIDVGLHIGAGEIA
jgi:hypothetical protein